MIFSEKPVPTPDQVRGGLFRDHALETTGCLGCQNSNPKTAKLAGRQSERNSAALPR
jgi:hypothetical protein